MQFLLKELSLCVAAETQHQFNARESDWGFTSFMPLSELYEPTRGYLVNDTVLIEAEVAVRKVLDYWSYDSKKRDRFCWTKKPRCYLLHEFSPADFIPHTLL